MDKPGRHNLRLPGYDYASSGCYYVTLCTQHRSCLFGDVTDEQMRHNDYGDLVTSCWENMIGGSQTVYTLMPNHMHLLVPVYGPCVDEIHANTAVNGMGIRTLGQLIGAFKYETTKQVNVLRKTPGVRVWQRNYYEHIVRDQSDLDRIAAYITMNPLRWHEDKYYAY